MSHPMLDLIGKITALSTPRDATTTPDNGYSKDIPTLMRAFLHLGISPESGIISGQTGGKGFMDTLSTLAGGVPLKIQDTFGNLGEFEPGSGTMRMQPPRGVDIEYPVGQPYYMRGRNWDEQATGMSYQRSRAVAAHEFAHLMQSLEPLAPDLLGYTKMFSERHAVERMADDFAVSLSKVVPDVDTTRGYPHLFKPPKYNMFTSGSLDSFNVKATKAMDSLVADKVRKLAKPRPSQAGESYP